MTRIILTRYDDGGERLVVGWDHPSNGCFYQEFNQGDDEPEVLRDGGMMNGIPITALVGSMPDDLSPYVTDEVLHLLGEHAEDPDSGYKGPNARPVDLTRRA